MNRPNSENYAPVTKAKGGYTAPLVQVLAFSLSSLIAESMREDSGKW